VVTVTRRTSAQHADRVPAYHDAAARVIASADA